MVILIIYHEKLVEGTKEFKLEDPPVESLGSNKLFDYWALALGYRLISSELEDPEEPITDYSELWNENHWNNFILKQFCIYEGMNR